MKLGKTNCETEQIGETERKRIREREGQRRWREKIAWVDFDCW